MPDDSIRILSAPFHIPIKPPRMSEVVCLTLTLMMRRIWGLLMTAILHITVRRRGFSFWPQKNYILRLKPVCSLSINFTSLKGMQSITTLMTDFSGSAYTYTELLRRRPQLRGTASQQGSSRVATGSLLLLNHMTLWQEMRR